MTNYQSAKRKERIDAVFSEIEENEPVGWDKIISEAVYQFGVQEDKAREYIQVLIDTDRVVENEGELEATG